MAGPLYPTSRSGLPQDGHGLRPSCCLQPRQTLKEPSADHTPHSWAVNLLWGESGLHISVSTSPLTCDSYMQKASTSLWRNMSGKLSLWLAVLCPTAAMGNGLVGYFSRPYFCSKIILGSTAPSTWKRPLFIFCWLCLPWLCISTLPP